MNRFLSSLLFMLLLFNSCNGQEVKTTPAERDTSITPATSFSTFFLDSTKLERFIRDQKADDSVSEQLRNFYKRRNYQFAWFSKDGIAEHTKSFWNLHNNYINNFGDTALKYKPVHDQVDLWMLGDTINKISNEKILEFELGLTQHFFEYSKNAYLGKLDPSKLQWNIPRRKIDVVVLLDSLISRKGQNLPDWEPVNMYYQHLKKELLRYHQIDKAGGWKIIAINTSGKYRPGDTALLIKEVKEHLQITGDNASNDTTEYYTNDFIAVIKTLQKSFGFKQDGIITAALINELNVPVKERIKQILINLERMRWIPQPEENLILVNIPEFKMHVVENKEELFSINVVVGKAAHNTVIFTGQLKHVVFNPYWNVPRSIVRNEILPALKRDPNYLTKMNMEQTGYSGGLPVIRQKPGASNALGKVKFIFPNNYNIYFHDTPAKTLFSEDKRAFSHGCIRLAEPVKLATYLLRNQPEGTSQKMNDAMSVSKERWVLLKKPVPVFITYFTSWVDTDGLLNFREDIYGHDKKLADQLFQQ